MDYSFYSVTLVGFFAGISSGLLVKLYKASENSPYNDRKIMVSSPLEMDLI